MTGANTAGKPALNGEQARGDRSRTDTLPLYRDVSKILESQGLKSYPTNI